jgi:catechol 2,3-dioxygenase-like lactoylglutathione lyase family enzyme
MSKVAPVLQSLNVVVRDVDAAVAFYRRLGVEIPDSIVWRTPTGAHHVDIPMPGGIGLDLDSPELAKVYNAAWRNGPEPVGRNVIGFSVETREAVDECYETMIEAGYHGLQPPYDAFWGARYAIICDPDGNHVGVMSPLDPTRRKPGPSL